MHSILVDTHVDGSDTTHETIKPFPSRESESR